MAVNESNHEANGAHGVTNGNAKHEPNLHEVHDFLVDLAKKAGEMITGAKPIVDEVGSKKNCQYPLYVKLASMPKRPSSNSSAAADLVTETDQAVEEMVSKSLRSKYPDYE